jgi:16S rRNA (adenine1518-N6/adenine1519-N6)-dimethyltransferase
LTRHPTPERVAVVGNLPYNISKPIAMRMIDAHRRVTRAVFMFQSEVADRLTSSPGGRDYGPLTVLAGRAYRIERSFDLGPGSFRPRPTVRSTVTRWVPREDRPTAGELHALRVCLRACFASRRKTLSNNLRTALGCDDRAAARLLAGAGLDPGARAETVPPDGFVRLARRWPQPRRGAAP